MTIATPRRPEIGDLSQIASHRAVRLSDGSEDGVRAVDVRVAGGIHAQVILDRGMDLGPAWYAGHPLAWQSPTGIVHPSYFRDDVWLRSFHGGLLFTAGLQNVGSAVQDGDESHGLHGRISNLPAHDVRSQVIEDAGGLAVVVSGAIRETTVYGVDLVLHRRLTFRVGQPIIDLEDVVENRGYAACPVYLLYHVNLGHPVVAPTSRLISPSVAVEGWDDASRAAEPDHAVFHPPSALASVQVFEHRLDPGTAHEVTVGVVNPEYPPTGGIGLSLTYDRRRLPHLWQWRMLGEGLYVTGLEPANCRLNGRVAESASDEHVPLEPGASRAFGLRIRAAVGAAATAMASGVHP